MLNCISFLWFGIRLSIGKLVVCLICIFMVFLIWEIVFFILLFNVVNVLKLLLNIFIVSLVFILVNNLLKCICIGCKNL